MEPEAAENDWDKLKYNVQKAGGSRLVDLPLVGQFGCFPAIAKKYGPPRSYEPCQHPETAQHKERDRASK